MTTAADITAAQSVTIAATKVVTRQMVSDSVAAALASLPFQFSAAQTTGVAQTGSSSSPVCVQQSPPIMSTTTGQQFPPRAHSLPAGWIQGSDNVHCSTNVTLAVG